MVMTTIGEIKKIHHEISPKIRSRLDEFKNLWESADEKNMTAELAFCILTPQSRARTCWAAVERLMKEGLLENPDQEMISLQLRGVRFKTKKAGYITEALRKFKSARAIQLKINGLKEEEAREWLVENIKGIGYKEASHFLRNIGFSKNLAILDRHVLKNLKALGVIKEIPESLSRRNYLEIENRMRELSEKIKIPMNHLDLVLWYREAGEVFK
jgi:N-glycosylase/DNA lyase